MPMRAHRAQSTVSEDGSVTVRGVPFSEGDEVEVIVLPRPRPTDRAPGLRPLRGSVNRYDDPFEPASDVTD